MKSQVVVQSSSISWVTDLLGNGELQNVPNMLVVMVYDLVQQKQDVQSGCLIGVVEVEGASDGMLVHDDGWKGRHYNVATDWLYFFNGVDTKTRGFVFLGEAWCGQKAFQSAPLFVAILVAATIQSSKEGRGSMSKR